MLLEDHFSFQRDLSFLAPSLVLSVSVVSYLIIVTELTIWKPTNGTYGTTIPSWCLNTHAAQGHCPTAVTKHPHPLSLLNLANTGLTHCQNHFWNFFPSLPSSCPPYSQGRLLSSDNNFHRIACLPITQVTWMNVIRESEYIRKVIFYNNYNVPLLLRRMIGHKKGLKQVLIEWTHEFYVWRN